MGLSEDARFNIDARLKTKEDEFAQAVMLAHGLRLEVLADDGVVVPTEGVRVSVVLGDRGPRPVTVRRSRSTASTAPPPARRRR